MLKWITKVFSRRSRSKTQAWGQGWIYPLGKVRWLPWVPKSQGPLKCFSYTRCALSADTQTVSVYSVTTTTVCVSELNVLLVYPACSKYKYYASEADWREVSLSQSKFSLSLSLSLSLSPLSLSPLSLSLRCSVQQAAEIRSYTFS